MYCLCVRKCVAVKGAAAEPQRCAFANAHLPLVAPHPCVPCTQVLMNPKDAQGKDITWKNAAALEGYVRRLNEVADRLAEKNRCALLAISLRGRGLHMR